MKEKQHSILALVPYNFLPAFNGGQRDIYHLLSGINNQIGIACLCLRNEQIEELNFKLLPELPNSKWRYINPFFIFELRKKLKENDADVLFIFHPFLAWQAVILKMFFDFKLIVRSQNIEYQRFKSFGKWYWSVIRILERWVHRKADLNLFISEEDTHYAINEMKVAQEKAMFVPYGVPQKELIDAKEIALNEKFVKDKHSINKDDKIVLFNGTLNYLPNENAVIEIIEKINPMLQEHFQNVQFVICGKGLSDELVRRIEESSNIIYTGFVDDIDVYFKACEILINPVIEGGGVKTKLVEALGFGKAVISYSSGSYGVDPGICNGRLHIVEDNDSEAMVEICKELLLKKFEDDNAAFYKIHFWGNIGNVVAQKILSGL